MKNQILKNPQEPDDKEDTFLDNFRWACGEVLKKYPEIQKKAEKIKKERGKNNGQSD